MKTLKDYMHTFAKSEASMAENYIITKTLEYSLQYFQQFSGMRHHVWNEIEEPRMYEKLVQGGGWNRQMTSTFWEWIYDFILDNFCGLGGIEIMSFVIHVVIMLILLFFSCYECAPHFGMNDVMNIWILTQTEVGILPIYGNSEIWNGT